MNGLLRACVGMILCVAALPAVAAGSEAEPFGIASFTMRASEAGNGLMNEPNPFTQAAGHPFALTSTVQFASQENGAVHVPVPAGNPENVIIDLPAGLVANPQALPRCPAHVDPCPTDTQVGVFELRSSFEGSQAAILGPIVNLTSAGQAAELGLETPFGTFPMSGRLVRTAQGYTVAIAATGLPELGILSMQTTLWGIPAATAHDPQRGLTCSGIGANPQWTCHGGGLSSGEEPVPFLTMPSDCSETQVAVAWADSWEQPKHYVQTQSTLAELGSCEGLVFRGEISLKPETLRSEQPIGVDMNIEVAQFERDAVAAPELREATVTLPEGMSINPAVAYGLQACDASGSAGIDIPTGLNTSGERLDPEEAGAGEELSFFDEPELTAGHCPRASTIGTAEASTPLLAHPLDGRVYIATPACGGAGQNGCTEQDAVDGNLYRLYVELGSNTEQDDGVLIKLAAMVQANPTTGQLTVRLAESPQLPLSELSLHLFGGERALLTNPTTCGAAITTSQLEPWSAPYTPDGKPSSYYDVTDCQNAPLDPGFLAGSTDTSAGSSTPFVLAVTRNAGGPFPSAVQMHSPPGLSAMLSGVLICEGALASTGKCPEASRVGSSEVAVGTGSLPLYMPGNIYLTGPYNGAPFGLSVVTEARAGPLDLGQVIIRAQINIDPLTAALTISTDPLPQIVLGFPLRIQRMSFDIDRPGFIVNPTGCEPQRITATIADALGVQRNVSSPFGLGGCASLAFKPKLTASTNAHTTLATGASLDMKLTFPKTEQGTQANLARIVIALPKHLPSRLTTLQDACSQPTFDTNPATCPSGSVVGSATAHTPVLPGGLTGPVYFVAHGADTFPSPIIILQGDGVTLEMRGSTIIDKTGVVSVAFETIPDIPIESFQLDLPQGVHSLLNANTSLCALAKTVTVKRTISRRVRGHTLHRSVTLRERLPPSLAMPTELAAHNGAVVRQSTKIEVVGCTTSKSKLATAVRFGQTPTR